MKTNYLLTIILVIVAGAGAFFGGMQYQKSQRGNFNGFNGQAGQFTRRFGANGQNRGRVVGQIISQDNNSITVKLPDGSSKIVIVSSTTTINKEAAGSKSDLKQGENVTVFGTNNSDGSVTAQSIQLNPQARGIQGGQPKPTQGR